MVILLVHGQRLRRHGRHQLVYLAMVLHPQPHRLAAEDRSQTGTKSLPRARIHGGIVQVRNA